MLLLLAAGCSDNDSHKRGVGEFDVSTSSRNPAVKDMTLLHGDSRLQTDSLPGRIKRLKREIARGESIYTREELGILERKLADSEEQFRVIQHP
ncbi:hypothetical protein GeomeDRAFT_2245 [Geobacter metallireducens RCH3]|nr:hypothetical protein GeomeDRAFT_2245 [Geobacter metallireducens RCH3]